MAADEGKFGRIGEVRLLVSKGIRPTVPKQQVRQYVYAYAAVGIGSNDLPDSALCQYQDDEFIFAPSLSRIS